MYKEDNYVVLETGQSEQFLTAPELLEKLQGVLQELEIADLPRDLQKLSSIQEQAKSLLDTSCELDVGRGKYLQWYAVRLEK
jgi:Protein CHLORORESPIRATORY REDUCTION 7